MPKDKSNIDKLKIGAQWLHKETKETFEVVDTQLGYHGKVETIYLHSIHDGWKRFVPASAIHDYYTYIPPMKGAYK